MKFFYIDYQNNNNSFLESKEKQITVKVIPKMFH